MSSTRGQHVVQRVVGVVDWCYVTTWMDCEESSGESYLFSKEWSGEQELELLCAIEQHGYGNWEGVGSRVGRTPEECARHYNKYYIESPICPLARLLPHPLCGVSVRDNATPTMSCDQPQIMYPGQEIPHYNPLRGDFDVEFDNDAEKILTVTSLFVDNTGTNATDEEDENESGTIVSDDRELENKLMLTLYDSYWRRLQRRRRVKYLEFELTRSHLTLGKHSFATVFNSTGDVLVMLHAIKVETLTSLNLVREHGLIQIYKILSEEHYMDSPEKEIRCSMKPFFRFLNTLEAEKLVQSFLHEHQLKEKVKNLQEYRKLGIKNYFAVKIYEKRKKKREADAVRLKKALGDLYKFQDSTASKLTNFLSESACGSKIKYVATPLDVSQSPGVELLDAREKELCSAHRILPKVYCHCKSAMIAECEKNGSLKLKEARKLCRIDVNKTRKIYNLLLEKGLIGQ